MGGMSASVRQGWTRDGFLAWAEAQEERYEFDGAGPVPMTGGTVNHSLIHGTVAAALRSMAGGAFLVMGPDAGIATIGDTVRYPDVLVTLARPSGTSRLVPRPLVLFEVVSPTSGKTDRIAKVREYAAVPSVRCYVIVESTSVGLTVLSRKEPGAAWTATTLAEEDVLVLDALGVELPVAAIYDGIDFGT